MRRLLALIVLLAPAGAVANPFTIARYGGLKGTPSAKGALGMYWNPAGIALPGLHLDIHLMGVQRQATFKRPPFGEPPPGNVLRSPNVNLDDFNAANTGDAETSARGVVPALFVSYGIDYGDWQLGFGSSIHLAQAGNSRWKSNLGAPERFPGASDGVQRFGTINTTMTILTTNVGMAVKHKASGLSFGVAPGISSIRLAVVRARNPDKRESLEDLEGNLAEGRILFEDGRDQGLSLIAGAQWEASEVFSLSASYHRGIEFDVQGNAFMTFGLADETRAKASINMPTPDMYRVEAAWKVDEAITLRPLYEFGGWAAMKSQTAINESLDTSRPADERILMVLKRDFKNTHALHLRMDWDVAEALDLHFGAGYETGATPEKTHEPGLAENDNWLAAIGATIKLSESLTLGTHFFWHQFIPRKVSVSEQDPAMNGDYTDRRQYLTVDLGIHL